MAAAAGILVGAYLLAFIDPTSFLRLNFFRWIIMGLFGLFSIIFALGLATYRKYIFGSNTAVAGSFVLFVGIDFFARVGFTAALEDLLQGFKTNHLDTQLIVFQVALGVCMILGSLLQLRTGRHVEFEPKKNKTYYAAIVNI